MKTKTVVARTQYMILDGVKPSNILLFTFTNKAAKEIKERIAKAVGPKASDITIGTYHSFCCRLLRKYANKLGYDNNFTIFDSEDSSKIIKKIIDNDDIDDKMLASYISKKKHKVISAQEAMTNASANKDPYAKYYNDYQNELKKQNSMDFDDLIYNTIRLLEGFPDIKAKINSKYLYVTSDESQDSSKSDIRLMDLLSGKEKNICFMLDEDQSIYGFRGADIQSVMNIRNLYPNFNTYVLGTNYRSTSNIVNGSRSLIAKNTKMTDKTITANKGAGSKIMCVSEKNAINEGIRVAKLITSLHVKHNVPYNEIAILYRTSGQSRAIEDILLQYKIPYNVLSGTNFYARKEVKDIVSFVYFLVNPYNVERFTRIVNIPKGGIGDKTIEKIVDESRKDVHNFLDLITASKNLLEQNKIKGKAKESLKKFIERYNYFRDNMDDMTISELITEIIQQTDYYNYLKSEEKNETVYEDRCSNIMELIELSYEFDSIEEFLEHTCLDRKDDDKEDSRVNLLTMHMSKGLEYSAVFIIGCNEGTSPHFKSLASNTQVEEERRVFYVGMTRAKDYLFLLRPETIKINGFYTKAKESRFIQEIDKQYVYKA